ncbi:MAG: HAMP domain-containing sensor histidine kinase [Lachnospiraceae bacterium]|nr:HAMP domain-containing sensor histidine kinase [Lachnospiraceae bacterium]
MIRKMHLQLTTLCSAITGLILAVLTIICLFISESDIRRQEYSSFQTNLNTMYQNLTIQTTLSHTWLRQMEYNYQISIRIIDNGSPLFFQELSKEDTTRALMDQIETIALKDYGLNLADSPSPSVLAQHEEFPLEMDGQSYFASAALVPLANGLLGVTVFHPLASMQERIYQQRISFLLADLAALSLLILFFWFFTAKMIRPLQENHRKQTQFIASASHELRSPLTVILSNVDAVKNHSIPCDEQFLDTIDSEGKRMTHLINDMLQLASADNHSWSIHPSQVEIDTLLLQTWENFEALASVRGLHWDISLPEDSIPECLCDSERIRQLLAILIDNAFSYTPKGGHVSLTLKKSGSCLHIQIVDDGPGIPDDQKKAVFERFRCLDSSHKNKAHFGLGLCIAKEIVRLHKGQLLLSDTPGGGATFTIVLPV